MDRPNFWAIAAEIVYSPDPYSLLTKNSPNSRKPIEAPSTDQLAANPETNASCAVPTVDLAPINSDISSTPMTAAGSECEAVMNWSTVRLRSRTVSQLVSRIYATTITMMTAVPKASNSAIFVSSQ